MIEEEHIEYKELSKTEKCPDCGNTVELVSLGARQGIFCECGFRRTRKA